MALGRPPHQPTEDSRRKVSIAAGGMTPRQIAAAMGMDVKTLEKHYAAELEESVHARRMEVLVAMHENALKGNVAAQRAYLSLEPHDETPPAAKEEPPGKKQQADIDAKTADRGSKWDGLLPKHEQERRTLQ